MWFIFLESSGSKIIDSLKSKAFTLISFFSDLEIVKQIPIFIAADSVVPRL